MKKARTIMVAMALSGLLPAFGQWNDFGGNSISSTEYLGANGSSTVPLLLKTVANQPIDFSTADLFRARINEKVDYPFLNTFPNIPAHGFTLITPDDGFLHQAPRGPFSRLHLAEGGEDGNAEQWGYRPWQRNGITFTGNGDQGYVGQKYNADNETDMVMQWSDNPGNWRGDRLRFIFTGGYDPGAPAGRNSLEGEEGMRLYPTVDYGINVGIGDFFADGSDPTERLHVLDGRVRIQQLPDDPEAEELTKFMVVDDTDPNSDEYGVVKWRHLPVVPPATSCDWTLNPTTHNNVSTAFGPTDPDCPDDGDAVGIGVDLGAALAEAKLNVASKINGIPVGINVEVNKPAVNPSAASLFGQKIKVNVPNYADAYGMDADVNGHGYRSRGVRAVTKGTAYVSWAGDFTVEAEATYSVGVHGSSTSGTAHSVGVHGVSSSETNGNYGTVGEVRGSLGQVQIGLYGRQWSAGPSWINPPSGNYGLFATTEQFVDGTDWAGWFRGNVNVTGLGYIPGGTWASSDENVKENVADLSNAMAVIMALTPKSYDYLVDEYPQLGLPSGQQFGFLAQELEQVIPEAV